MAKQLNTTPIKELPIKNTGITDDDYVVVSSGGTKRLKIKEITKDVEKKAADLEDKTIELSSQLDTMARQRVNVNSLGLFASDTEDITDKLQSIINENDKLFFPNGKYIISRPIFLKSNIDILCDVNAEFFLKDMSKCIMFDTDKNLKYENITFKGGMWNGNDYGQGEQSDEGLFNFSHAFRFFTVKNLKVTDVLIKDIRGHAIQHWNCDGVIFENIIFDQNVDLQTKPAGGSRRDGITGGSSNVTYRNISGFTDDDMIAILSGVSWGGVQVKDVENIIIDNVTLHDKYIGNGEYHNTWCGIRLACCNNYTTRNVKIQNVSGKSANWIVRLGGYDTYRDGFLEDIIMENINHYGGSQINTYNEMGSFLVEQCECKKLTLNNVTVNSKHDYKGTLLFNRNAKIKELFLNNIVYYHENTGNDNTEAPLIKDYWNNGDYTNIYIDNIMVNNIMYNSNINLMHLYKKQKTHSENITNITHIEGNGII